jgi:hypothetical protein
MSESDILFKLEGGKLVGLSCDMRLSGVSCFINTTISIIITAESIRVRRKDIVLFERNLNLALLFTESDPILLLKSYVS